MSIVFVDPGLVGGAANGNDVTLSLSGAQEGDAVFLFGGFADNASSSGTPAPVSAGYTERAMHDPNVSGEPACGVWTKFMGASPDANVVGNGPGNTTNGCAYGRYILRGLDPAVLDAAVVKVVTTTGFANPGAVITQTPNATVIVIVADVSSSGTPTAAPSGYGNFLAKRQSENWPYTLGAASKEVASPGSEDPGLFTWDTVFSGRFQVVFTIALREEGAAGAKPLAPDLTMEGGAGTARWNTSDFQPHPDDPTDTHQSTKYQLDDTDDTFGSLVVDKDLGDPNLTTYLKEGLGAGTYYGRAAHVGDALQSDWSNVVQVEVTAGVTAGDTPTLSPVENAHDFIEVEISAYNHPDGEVEPSAFDPDDPKPWLQKSEIQARLASDPDWSTPLETIEVTYVEGDATSRRARFDSLSAGTAYKFRGRQLDGHLAVYTAYSADLNQSTDAAPANAPLKPTVSITCGRSIVMTGSAYQHASSGAGTNHAKTEARICYGSKCQSVIVNSPVTTFTWPDNPPGSANVYLRYGDDSTPTRWGPYSDADPCTVPDYPPVPYFTAPTNLVITTNDVVNITWDFYDPNAVGWTSDIRRSVGGGAFTTIATDQVAESTTFDPSAFSDGDVLFQVRSRNPTTDETGEWATLPLVLDRTATTRVFHKTPAQLAAGGGTQIWDGASHITWTGQPGLGLFASRVHTGSTVRRSGYVWPSEHGEPDEFDLIVQLEHVPEECEWYPHRFANAYVTRGGAMTNGVDGAAGTRSGRQSLVDVGIQPWYLGANMPCVSDLVQAQALAVTAKRGVTHPNNQWRYGRSYGLGKLRTVTARNGTATLSHSNATLPSSTSPASGGPHVYTDPNNELGNARQPMFVFVRQRRAVQGGTPGWTIQTRFMGAGVAFQQWHHTQFVAEVDAQGRTIPCGNCGLAFEDMDEGGVGRSEGILFMSMTLRVVSYGTCDEIEPPCVDGYPVVRVISKPTIRPESHELEYLVIGTLPCPEEVA